MTQKKLRDNKDLNRAYLRCVGYGQDLAKEERLDLDCLEKFNDRYYKYQVKHNWYDLVDKSVDL